MTCPILLPVTLTMALLSGLSFAKADASLDAQSFTSPTQLIDTVIELDQLIESHEHWHRAGIDPRNLVQQFEKLTEQTNYNKDACSHFDQLTFKQLTLFIDVLESPSTGKPLECQSELLAKLDYGYSVFKNRMHKKVALVPHSNYGFHKTNSSSSHKLFSQPGLSIEQPISALNGPVLTHGDLPPKHISLTFDDGPHPNRTQELLSILRQQGIQATFFCIGQNIKRWPQTVHDIVNDGHAIGTHSYSHPDMRRLSRASAEAQIFDAVSELINVIGFSDPFFRFPYGAKTRHLQDRLKQSNIATFFWNVDTLDWKIRNPDRLYDYAVNQVERAGRGIVLFHDIHRQTLEMMPAFIETMKRKGYKFVVFSSPDTITDESLIH